MKVTNGWVASTRCNGWEKNGVLLTELELSRLWQDFTAKPPPPPRPPPVRPSAPWSPLVALVLVVAWWVGVAVFATIGDTVAVITTAVAAGLPCVGAVWAAVGTCSTLLRKLRAWAEFEVGLEPERRDDDGR